MHCQEGHGSSKGSHFRVFCSLSELLDGCSISSRYSPLVLLCCTVELWGQLCGLATAGQKKKLTLSCRMMFYYSYMWSCCYKIRIAFSVRQKVKMLIYQRNCSTVASVFQVKFDLAAFIVFVRLKKSINPESFCLELWK